MGFESFELNKVLTEALQDLNFEEPTPIQKAVIPLALDEKDVVGCAQTGTGKTAAFAIPILQLIHQIVGSKKKRKQIRTVILSPTRELAIQIGEAFEALAKYTNVRILVIYGGVSQDYQVQALKEGVDVLVATPGRFLDLHKQKHISLDSMHQLVIDEADLMLDMGFLNDVKKIVKLSPANRQSLLFSATIPLQIRELIDEFLPYAQFVDITPSQKTQELIEQKVYFVEKEHKKKLLATIVEDLGDQQTILFTRTKKGADLVADFLNGHQLKAGAFHGDKSQAKRMEVLEAFKNKELNILVATDVASRGIDIEAVPMVINYDIPNIPEVYIHRIGRTGRAGNSGKAISFVGRDEKTYWKSILRLLHIDIKEVKNHPYPWDETQQQFSKHKKTDNKPSNQNKSRKSANSKKNKKRWY